jgi:hypothetical protein
MTKCEPQKKCIGDWIMRSLWELDISTAVPNNQQAEFGTTPAAEAKFSTAAFLKLFMFREIGIWVSLVKMSRPSLRTVAPPPCLPLDIKDSLKEDTVFFDGRLMGGFFLDRDF